MPAPEELVSTSSATTPDFYTWTFPGAPVRIHLQLSVVERLSHEIRRAFESVPFHSVEIGGLLLGTADFKSSPIVEVTEFEPFRCEYRTDHKFILSDSDRRKLEKTVAARRADGLMVVGFYRSHIGESLSLTDHDLALAKFNFYDPANVFLLIKPSADGSASAGFFFWDNGRIDSEFTFLEFPFDARLLTGARVKPVHRPDDSEPPADAEPEESTGLDRTASLAEPGPPDASPSFLLYEAPHKQPRSPLRWLLYLLFAGLMSAAGIAGYFYYLQWNASHIARGPQASDAPALSLQVERRGNDLRVSWRRNSPVIAAAKEGVLSIRDSSAPSQDLHLDADQLSTGSVTYTPQGATVQFRLEVAAEDGKPVSESVFALAAPKASSAPNPSSTEIPVPVATSAPLKSDSFPSSEPVRVVIVDPLAQPDAGPDKASASDPLYVPPRPLRQTQPSLSASARRTVVADIEVDIRVEIGETGRVFAATPMASTGPVNSELVAAARSAARLWRFAPATRGGKLVASEAVLKFQYRPVRPVN